MSPFLEKDNKSLWLIFVLESFSKVLGVTQIFNTIKNKLSFYYFYQGAYSSTRYGLNPGNKEKIGGVEISTSTTRHKVIFESVHAERQLPR